MCDFSNRESPKNITEGILFKYLPAGSGEKNVDKRPYRNTDSFNK